VSRSQRAGGTAPRQVLRDQVGYPIGLGDAPDAPERLFVSGSLPAPDAPRVAIVGARAASANGMDAARTLAAELAGQGAVIVSGGAIGIDAAAHRGALDAGGRTVAVLANGIDAPYPARNRPLFEAIRSQGGALVSPFLPGTPPRRWQFVRRNRIIAAWADAVVVVEAESASGALYTARAALEFGRALGARPGTPGCEALIAQGAAVVETAADLQEALSGRPRRPDVAVPEPDSDLGMVLAALDRESARGEDELTARTGLGARAVSRALMGLELEGLAVPLPGRAYVRSGLANELLAT